MAKADKNGTAQQYGHWFQDRVQDALDELMREGPWLFQRLYDTGSAASFLPAQPADFIGTAMGIGYIVEAKATMKFDSFDQPGAMRGLLKDHQALACYLQARAGGLALIVFRSKATGSIEVWDGAKVREMYITPRARLSPKDGFLQRVICEGDNDKAVTLAVKHLLTTVMNDAKTSLRRV